MFFLSRIFRRRRPKIERPDKIVNKVVVGLIIGGAIASIIGKAMLDEKKKEEKQDD
jgi:hypothetical protein